MNREQIAAAIAELGQAERITKDKLAILSRAILTYILVDDGSDVHKPAEDSQVINQLLEVLTPLNKKVAVAFFSAFAGFFFDDELSTFGKKDKKRYDGKRDKAIEFLKVEDNTIWTWAERNIVVQPTPMDFAKLNQVIGNIIKKAEKANLGHDQVLKACLANGVSINDMMNLLAEMAKQEQPAEQQQEQAAA